MGLQRHIWILAASAAALCGTLMLASPSAWASAPTATTEPAKFVKRANAVLEGVVNPEGSEATYYFEYGPEACAVTCGTKTPTEGPIPGTAPQTVKLKIKLLKPGTSYHYWLVASNSSETVHGSEQTFTTASAEPKEYVPETEITGTGSKENPTFTNPLGVGTNQTTGDVYIADKGAFVIDQFNAAGVFQASTKLPPGSEEDATFNLAVDNSCYLRKLDTTECQTDDPSNGDVYISDVSANVVYKFDPNSEGKLELDRSTPKIGEGILSEPRGVAIDSNGNLYVTSEPGTVFKFSSTGEELNAQGAAGSEPLLTGLIGPFGLAVDTSNNIYVTGENGAFEYTSKGVCIDLCMPINIYEGHAVTLDSAGDVFISVLLGENEWGVPEYEPTEDHPQIKNPELERPGAFTSAVRGLSDTETTNTLYVAQSKSSVKVFRLLDVKPVVVTTEPATQVNGPVEALNGTVNPGGQEPAEYYFEYGTAPCNAAAGTCGTMAAEQSQVMLSGDEPIFVSVHLENLAPNSTYHYWIVGVNEESGIEHGEERTFTTGNQVPSPVPAPEGAAPESKTPANSPVYPLLTGIVPVPIPNPKRLTRAQQLAKALATCNRKPKKQRAACKRQARKKYGPVTKGVAKKRRK